MSNPSKLRSCNSLFEMLEQRTLFSGYALSPVVALPALSTTFVNTQPSQLVRDSSGNLYGVSPQGGAATYGTVFEVNPTTKALTVLYTFDGTHGADPQAVVLDSSGNLFGIASYTTETGSGSTGAGAGSGILFEITAADRSTVNQLYTFSNTTLGISPTALVVDSSNNIDVLADGDGANDGGAILQFSPTTNYGTATVLGSLTTTHFVYTDTLAIGSDGTLYGTSADGGGTGQGDGDGTLFSLSPHSTTINTLATFDKATSGSDPEGAPYIDASGNVFGTAQSGSGDANFYGDVWEYVAASGTLSSVAGISSSTTDGGIQPGGGVTPDGSGNFLGVTPQGVGSDGAGTVFSANPTTHTITDLAAFTTATGSSAFVGLTPDGAGNFYSVTTAGAANNDGAVYEVSPSSGGGGTSTGGGGTTTTGSSALTPTIIKSTLPTSIVSGANTNGSITVSVTNSGTAKNGGINTIALYATTAGSIDSSSTQIAFIRKGLPINPGKNSPVSFNFRKLSLAVGSYTILAQTTDAAGNVSASSTGPALTIAAATENLSAVVSAVKPTLAKVGKTISYLVTITNTGNTDSTGKLVLNAGLSTDGLTLAVPILITTHSPKVKANGKSPVKITVRFKLPTDLDFVDYFPFVSITQGTNSVSAAGPSFSPIFSAPR